MLNSKGQRVNGKKHAHDPNKHYPACTDPYTTAAFDRHMHSVRMQVGEKNSPQFELQKKTGYCVTQCVVNLGQSRGVSFMFSSVAYSAYPQSLSEC